MFRSRYGPRGLHARPVSLLSILPMLLAALNWQPLYEPGSGGAMVAIQVSPHNTSRILLAGDMLGNGISTDGGANWGGTFGFKSWEMADFTWHPTNSSTVWAASMMGPYKSTDGGVNWVEKRNGFPAPDSFYSSPVQKILFDPNNADRLLAFCGTHRFWGNNNTSSYGDVYESTNGGESWAYKSTIVESGNIMTAEFAPGSSSTIYAAVAGSGLYKSTNGGSSWSVINSGTPNLNVRFLAVHPTNGNTLWAAFVDGGGIYKSTNGGSSWSASNGGLPLDGGGASYDCVVVSQTNANVLYTSNTYPYWGNGGIYKSIDGGANWTKVTGSNYSVAYPAGPQMSWIEIDPTNENIVYACNTEYVLKTTNGGSSWTDMTAFRPGSDTGLWRGRGYSGLVSVSFAWNPYRTNHAALLAMDAGKMWVSKDGLYSWRRQSGLSAWSGGNAVTFSSANTNLMYATFGQFGYYDAIAKSTDGGDTWTAVTQPSGSSGTPLGIYMHPTDNAKVWVTVGGSLYASTDGGTSWSNVTPSGASSMGWIEGDRNNPLTFYVTAANGVYKTTNGASFSLMSGSPAASNGRDMRIEIDPSDTSRLYVANWRSGSNAGLHRYTSTGGWVRINIDYYAANAAVDPNNPNRLVMSTNDHSYHDYSGATGVYVTENALAASPTWVKEVSNLPMLRGEVIEFDPRGSGKLVFGSYGRGYFVTTVSSGGSIPSGWTAADIGSPSPAGSTSHSSGTWTVRGGGADIWGTSDQFHYVYRDASGDTTVIARVDSLTNTNGWAKAGVMIRNGTAANAQFAMVVATPSNGVSFQWRATTGGSAASSTTTGISAPRWVRIQRTGNSFTASQSSDGTNWTAIGTAQTISMPTATKAGLCVTSHANGTLCTATMTNVSVTGESGSTPGGSGTISREVWNNVSGTSVSQIPLSTAPSSTGTLTSFEAPTNLADNYGQRIRGYLTAPTTGSYTFWIAADDNCELWLSTNDQPSNKVRIAYHTDWTNSREWNKHSTQKSAAISLTAGSRYYVEALMKEGGGGDNLAVGWAKPGQSTTAPSEVIPGAQLSPWDGASAPSADIAIKPGTPTIDASIDSVWSSAVTSHCNNVNSGTVSSSSDLSATWRGLWDSSNLYLLVEVTDDSKNNDSANFWDDDGIELYLDGGNEKATSYDSNDRQYTFNWGDTTAIEGGGRNVTGVTFSKADASSTTYRIEARVPWSAVGTTASTWKLIGIDVHVNDDDAGGTRDGKKAWYTTTDNTWNNPSLMGTSRLD